LLSLALGTSEEELADVKLQDIVFGVDGHAMA
jgi:hypothetical protein